MFARGRTLEKLNEAIRLIHSHGPTAFHERVFQALDSLFEDSRYALEIFAKEGGYTLESNLPFHECRETDIFQRTEQLVKEQSPMFERLAAGESSAMRLSDFISLRELRRTDLYHEIFHRIHISHQIGIPIQSKHCLGGLTINRKRRDYTPEDVAVAQILAPQIATAFEVDQMIRKLAPQMRAAPEPDYAKLRRVGLSRRECEVMRWVAEGKRDGEIAIILNISPRTAQQHVHAIFKKLGVETRTAAVAHILKSGWLDGSTPSHSSAG